MENSDAHCDEYNSIKRMQMKVNKNANKFERSMLTNIMWPTPRNSVQGQDRSGKI